MIGRTARVFISTLEFGDNLKANEISKRTPLKFLKAAISSSNSSSLPGASHSVSSGHANCLMRISNMDAKN